MLSDNDGNLIIRDSDLQIGVSDAQHIQDTLYAAPGWWKENFTDGVNLQSYLNSSNQEQILCRSMKIQLQSDQYKVANPTARYSVDGKLTINPGATI